MERISEPKNTFEMLNDWDREMLEKGLSNIVAQMLEDFGGTLPDAIIFPETSARPLFFALQPVFRRLSEERGMSAPRSYAFSIKRPLTRDMDTMSSEEMREPRKIMKERAKEILHHEQKFNNTSRIAVIDDFATANIRTAIETRGAFDMPDMHVYAVLAMTNVGVQAGVVVDADNTDPAKRGGIEFSFSGTSAVGVTKRERYSKRSERIIPEGPEKAAFLQQKKQLREEMHAVGKKTAEVVIKKLREK